MEYTSNTRPYARNGAKISVCIPTLNAAGLIERCLKSVLNQTIEPFEILIADGYSDDDTVRIAGTYPKVKLVGFAKGVGKARKMLAERAAGDIIAWVDADVVVPSNWLESHLQIHLEKPEVMILSGSSPDGGRGLPNAYRTLSQEENIPNVSCEIKPVREWVYLIQMACTMKKKAFLSVNYDERLRVAEDWDFLIAAHKKGIRSFYSEGLFAFHIPRQTKRFRFRYIMYFGNYVFFLKKYGLWYMKFVPKDFVAFVLRMAMIYALPLAVFLSPIALLVYPIAWLINSMMYKRITPLSIMVVEIIEAVGEHLTLFNIL